ncbi:MAG: hypothetical protein R2705_03025 [Ilumatobacteraceae bacterium]
MTRYLIVEFGNGLWGAQQYLLRLRPLLERAGFVAVLATAPQSDLAEAWRDDGGTTVLVEASDRAVRTANDQAMSPRLLAREAARTVRSVARLRRVVARCEAELLHANSHWAHLDVALAGRMAQPRCSCICTNRASPAWARPCVVSPSSSQPAASP